MNEGRVVSSGGLDIAVEEYEKYFEEQHVKQSNALHSVMLPGREALPRRPAGPGQPLLRPASPDRQARSRGVQGRLALPQQLQEHRRPGHRADPRFEEAIAIIKDYQRELSHSRVSVQAGAGHWLPRHRGPRGLIYHRYRIGDDGLIAEAKIVPPTSQNLAQIEDDLRAYIPTVVGYDDAEATRRCEHLIRNYDPCISCATHFLKLKIER